MSQDDDLSDLLGSFMSRLRRYLDGGGPDDVIDRILAAGTVAAAAIMIFWSPSRKSPTFVSFVAAIGRTLWARRTWFGMGAEQHFDGRDRARHADDRYDDRYDDRPRRF